MLSRFCMHGLRANGRSVAGFKAADFHRCGQWGRLANWEYADAKGTMTEGSTITGGVVHDLPAELKDALRHDPEALATWHDITPLARNEWICWVESAKKVETRRKRIDWGRSNLH